MFRVRRTGFSLKNKCSNFLKSVGSDVQHQSPGTLSSADFLSQNTQRAAFSEFIKREPQTRKSAIDVSHLCKAFHEFNGVPAVVKEQWSRSYVVTSQTPSRPYKTSGLNSQKYCFVRSFASKASDSSGRERSEPRKDVSTVEDPFDAPTYNIPERPVTFTEGASYSVIILAGLGVAAAAAYAVFSELIFQPKEYKIFNKALERIQNDGQVRVRIGSPITGYGSESRNRAARQRIPNRTWTDEDGVEHVEVNFYIRGPHGAGKVYAEMFKDNVDKQWKFTYVIVDIKSPSPAKLMLESYVPA